MMSSGISADFLPTPWPGVPLDEPSVRRLEVGPVDGPWVELHELDPEVHTDAAQWDFDVPENAAERLIIDADASSVESLLELVVALHGHVVPVGRTRWRDMVSPHRGPIPTNKDSEYCDYVSNWSEALGLGPVDPSYLYPIGRQWVTAYRIHIAEVAARVWTLQTILRAISGAGTLERSVFGQPDFPNAPMIISAPWVAAHLSLFLGVFSPHVTFNPQWEFLGDGSVTERTGWPPTALEVAAVQMYNTLVRKDRFRACLHCGRMFSSSVGGAKYPRNQSHRRGDASYCQPKCQKAAGARKRRARTREKTMNVKADAGRLEAVDGKPLKKAGTK